MVTLSLIVTPLVDTVHHAAGYPLFPNVDGCYTHGCYTHLHPDLIQPLTYLCQGRSPSSAAAACHLR
jgi:hypothetical protein